MHGQLHLDYTVPSKLLELSDPYNPQANEIFRNKGLHDLTLYKDKIYMYYGPTPILLLYLPYQLITGFRLPDSFAVFVFTSGILIWATLLLSYLKKEYFENLPEWILLLAIAVVGFSNVGAFLLRRTNMYEVAISSGCFCITGAVYWFCRSVQKNNISKKMFIFGSLLLGLAVGCRFYFIFCSIVLLIYLFLIMKREKRLAMQLFLPFTLCLVIHFIYNYLRFDNIFENGLKHQLTAFPAKLFFPRSFISNFHSYVLQLPLINSTFPFFHIQLWKPPPHIPYLFERIVGFIPGIPFTVILFLIVFVNRFQIQKKFPLSISLIILIPAITNLFLLICYEWLTMRYVADFATLFIISTSIVCFYFDHVLVNSKLQMYLRLLVIISGITSILFGIAFSITGCFYGLENQNPEEFNKLQTWFLD